MNGTEEPLEDEGVAKRVRSQARWIYVESAIAALILTAVSFLFASVLPEVARSYQGLSLKEAVEFLIKHGYSLLFGWVLVEQMGLPIPAIPLLIAAGALAGSGKMDLSLAVSLALVAVMFWYSLGRHRGGHPNPRAGVQWQLLPFLRIQEGTRRHPVPGNPRAVSRSGAGGGR